MKKELPPFIHLRMYSYRVCADGRKLQAFALAGGAPAGGESDFTFKRFHAVDAQGVSVLGGVKVPGKMAQVARNMYAMRVLVGRVLAGAAAHAALGPYLMS